MLVDYSPPYDTAAHTYFARTIFPLSGSAERPQATDQWIVKRIKHSIPSVIATYESLIPVQVTGTHQISGTVLDQSAAPISRRVAAFSRSTMALLGESVSDPVTGEYTIELGQNEPCFVVCLPDTEEAINAKIFDKIQPLPI